MRNTNLAKNMKPWAVILAGGDGTGLQPLTRLVSGDDRPKQFCSLFGGPTLLELTKRRVGLLLPPEQTLTIVTQRHERFYGRFLDSQSNPLLVQPNNKGTAGYGRAAAAGAEMQPANLGSWAMDRRELR